MDRSPFALSPRPLVPGGPGGSSAPVALGLPPAPPTGGNALLGRCPMAHNCNCLFAPRVSTPRLEVGAVTASPAGTDAPASALDAEVAYWTNQGWKIIASQPGEVVVQRTLPESFCANLLLVAATGLLWSIHWIYRFRHPKIDTRRITVDGVQKISVELLKAHDLTLAA